jgi:hypothetical protein
VDTGDDNCAVKEVSLRMRRLLRLLERLVQGLKQRQELKYVDSQLLSDELRQPPGCGCLSKGCRNVLVEDYEFRNCRTLAAERAAGNQRTCE